MKAVVIGLDAAVSSLVEEYLAAGKMPNLKRLIEEGVYTRARSVFPGVTPINWATVSTGAYPGTHGITDFMVLEPGDPLDGGRDTFLGETYQAETLWQAASRAGHRVATLNFPGADQSQHENHLWVAGRGSPASYTPYAIRNISCFATEPYAPALRDSIPITLRDRRAVIQLSPEYGEGAGLELELEVSRNAEGEAGALVRDLKRGAEVAFLRPHRPGPWLWGEFGVGGTVKRASYRLELAHFDADRPALAVYVSQITCPRDIATPPEMGEALVEAIGPFIGYCGARGYDRGWVPARRMVEEGRYKGVWMARAARHLVTRYDYQLVMLKWHLLDHIQHAIWGGFDPISPWYEAERAPEFESLMEESYMAADAMIGELLPLLKEGVTLVVVSDHGHLPHLRAVSINNLLAQHGLIHTLPTEDDPPQVDWSRTQVFGGPALGHIWVNLKGRQPQGIVASREYESLRQRVIDLLLALRDPETGAHPVARAMRKQEARELGLWGSRVGDIVYLMEPGYSGDFNWSPLSRDGEVIVSLGPGHESTADYGQGKFIADKFQSVHGCGDPAASLGRGTEEAILAMAGPSLRRGAQLEAIPNLTVVAPTLAAATGLPAPAHSEGVVLESWLER